MSYPSGYQRGRGRHAQTIARHLVGHDRLGEAERHALGTGREVRRGQGYSLHVTALPDIHHALSLPSVAAAARSAW